MTTAQKQRRQEEARQPAQTPLADAIVLGTVAGGLVLGTMEAQAATETDSEPASRPDLPDTPEVTVVSAVSPADTQSPEVQDTPVPATALLDMAIVDPVDTATIPLAATQPAAAAPLDNPIPPSVQDQLVLELSQQMAGTISKVMESVQPGMSADELSESIASDIVQSAQEIVAHLDLGPLLGQALTPVEADAPTFEPPAIAEAVLGAASSIADDILAEVATLPGDILASTLGGLAELPSALLGNEGLEGPNGLLADLFYADGNSDGLSIPDLSQAASTLVADAGNAVGGLLGLSYVDGPDLAGGHGLNALSLL